jgi:CrcB protein
MTAYLWVALGGALGSVARFWMSGFVAEQCAGALARLTGQRLTEVFPWGTMTVNVLGSLVIGLIAALVAPEGRLLLAPVVRQQFLMLGVLGGFTTFSSFSLQTLNLMRDGQWLMAAANVLLSVTLCMVAVWLGHLLGTLLNR